MDQNFVCFINVLIFYQIIVESFTIKTIRVSCLFILNYYKIVTVCQENYLSNRLAMAFDFFMFNALEFLGSQRHIPLFQSKGGYSKGRLEGDVGHVVVFAASFAILPLVSNEPMDDG